MGDWAPVLTAILAGLFGLAGYIVNQQSARRERKTELYAEALRAVSLTEELPYRILRRRDSSPETRERVGKEVDDVLEKIGFYQAWLTLDNPDVGATYVTLSGKSISHGAPQRGEAWATPPIATDPEAHINDIAHFGTEKEWKDCLLAMQRELRVIPIWADPLARRARRQILSSAFMNTSRPSSVRAGTPADPPRRTQGS